MRRIVDLTPTAIGNIDYFMNKQIQLQLDSESNEVVYAIIALKPSKHSQAAQNEIIYIGETSNFTKRIIEHQDNIKTKQYTQIRKYITPDMEYKFDYDIIRLASAPSNYSYSDKKRYLSHAECLFINKFKTSKKGNYPSETGDCSGIYRSNYKEYIKKV